MAVPAIVVLLVLIAAACGTGGGEPGDTAGEADGAEDGDAAEDGGEGDADDGEDGDAADDGGDGDTVVLQALEGSIGGLPLLIMQEEGLDEEFGFQGDFQFVPGEGASQNFLMGNVDVATDGDVVGAAIAITEGFDVKAFYPMGKPYVGIMVPGDSDLENPSDLVGATVGHTGFESGTTGLIQALLEDAYDIDVRNDIEFVEGGPPALSEMLQAGDIDAMFNFETFTSRAEVDFGARWLLHAIEGYEESYDGFSPWITNMVAHTEWLQENPELAYAVRDAYDEALRLLEESEYQIANTEENMEALGIEDQEVMDTVLANANEFGYFTNEWDEETIARAEEWLNDLADRGIIIEEVPEGIMTTLEEEIGPRP